MIRRFLLILVILAGCTTKERVPPEVVAQVGSRQIALADFERYLERNAGSDMAQIVPEAASALLDQYVQEVLLSEYAATRGIEISAERVAGAVRNDPGSTATEKRDEMRRDDLLAQLSGEVPPPTPDQINAYYQQFIRDFRFEERVRVSQILVDDEEVATDLADQLRRGASFGELASKHSLAPNAPSGGDLGWMTRADLPPVFENAIFPLADGERSGVIRTDTGFYIFEVTERQPPGTMSASAAEPLIRQRLVEDSVRKQLANALISARRVVPVKIFARRLPFAYTGNYTASTTE